MFKDFVTKRQRLSKPKKKGKDGERFWKLVVAFMIGYWSYYIVSALYWIITN